MARLWYFNPWNDLALGAGSLFYTPPPAAEELAASGATLPMWMAAHDDFVLVPDAMRESSFVMAEKYGLARPWQGEKIDECVPWGWSIATYNHFIAAGVDKSILPDMDYLETVRQLSHRKLTVSIHKALGSSITPVECFTLRQCREIYSKWGKVVGKYPWSSTGRGIFSGEPGFEDSFLNRCQGAINHQGSVMIEKWHDVVCDFAMLFYSHGDGRVEFRDYSLFSTNNRAYTSNILLPHQDILSILCRYIPLTTLNKVQSRLEDIFVNLIGFKYRGWLGVDMFIYRNPDSTFTLNPCVEVNLRLTMGVLAHYLTLRFLPPNFHGFLTVEEKGSHPTNNSSSSHYLSLNPSNLSFQFNVLSLKNAEE